jgi:hypothetical protein
MQRAQKASLTFETQLPAFYSYWTKVQYQRL